MNNYCNGSFNSFQVALVENDLDLDFQGHLVSYVSGIS